MKQILTITLISLLIYSCSKEEDIIPLPEAKFNTEFFVATLGEKIEFYNVSTNAVRYEWDFGDDNVSYVKNPEHSYEEIKSYEVVLKAYNINDEVSEYKKTVKIKYRSIKELWFISSARDFPSHDLPHNIFFFFGEVGNPENAYIVPFPSTFSIEFLPFGGPLSFRENVIFTDSDWFWRLIDNQYPIDFFGENDQLIFGATFNPTRIESINSQGGFGSFSFDETKNNNGEITNDYKVEIGYVFE